MTPATLASAPRSARLVGYIRTAAGQCLPPHYFADRAEAEVWKDLLSRFFLPVFSGGRLVVEELTEEPEESARSCPLEPC